VWYWGWYERKGGELISDEDGAMLGPFPIRRFYCPKCSRTFSWRPSFFVFGRSYAAIAFQQAFKKWAIGRPSVLGLGDSSWYQLDQGACKAFFRLLDQRKGELIDRMHEELRRHNISGSKEEKNYVSQIGASVSGRNEERRTLWRLTRRLALVLSGRKEQPRFSCHYIFIALARHPCGARYSLESA